MDALAATGFAVAGALASIPTTAIAYAAPAHGNLRVPRRWWRGAPARPATVASVSLLTGAAAALVAGILPRSPALPAFWLFGVLGFGLAIIDLRCRRLPHMMTGLTVIVSIACFTAAATLSGNAGPLLRALGVGSITATAMLIVAMALPGQLGLGDVAVAGAIGLNLGWLGWQAATAGMAAAFVIQGISALSVKARSRGDGIMPLGPALIAGWLVGVLSTAS